MADIQLFNFEGNDVRVTDQDGNPWFVGNDACDALGIDRSQLRRLDDDEKGLCSIQTLARRGVVMPVFPPATPSLGDFTMSNLIIADHLISQDAHGRYRLNDLHAASPEANNENRVPTKWVRLDSTHALINELQSQRTDLSFDVIASVQGGSNPGTYACEELVVAYAAWLNPSFHVHVLRVFLEAKAPQVQPQPPLSPVAQATVMVREELELDALFEVPKHATLTESVKCMFVKAA